MADEAKICFDFATKLFPTNDGVTQTHDREKLIECKNEIIKTFDERAEEFEEPGLDQLQH